MIHDIFFFANKFDNTVRHDEADKMTWDDMVTFFGSHTVTPDKDTLLFTCCTYKSENFVPTDDGKVRRCSENVIDYNCLMFDFDGNGNTLENVYSRFAGIRHLGYTSFNHLKDGETGKCRVIVPMLTPIPVAELKRRKKSILRWIQTDDESCLSISRGFYVPSHAAGREQDAFVWHEDGEILDWEVFEPTPELPPIPPRKRQAVTGGMGKVIWESFDIVQFMKDQGLYVRHVGGNKHDVNCPNIHHADGGTVIYEGIAGQFGSFHCSHTKCKGFNFFHHYKQKLGVGWMKDWCQREQEITESELLNKFRKV